MSSIRRALGVRLAIGALVLLCVAAALLYSGVRWLLTEQFDEGLRDKLATFATLIEQEGDYVELGFIEEAMPEFVLRYEPEYVQLWFADMEDWVLYRSPSLQGGDLPRVRGSEAVPRVVGLELPDGRPGRAISAEFVIENYDPGEENRAPARVALVLAKGTKPLDEALGILIFGILGVILLLIGMGWFFGSRAVRRGLRPLDDLANEVRALRDPLCAREFDRESAPAELLPLIDSYNQMVGQIRQAFERERRTAANLAHELRTPLAELMVLAESAQRAAAKPAESARRLTELREIGEQMSATIATLLELARMESGQVPLEVEAIDLAGIVNDCWSPLTAIAEAKGQRFRPLRGPGPVVKADRVALSILLGNLLRNAVDHAPEGECIECRVEESSRGCALIIANSANGFAPSHMDKLPEPSWRACAAREEGAHAGIGLSLVRRLAELLQIEHSCQLERGVFRSRLSFEAATSTSSAA